MKITTNNVPRPTVEADQLSPVERAWHDYLDWPAIDRGDDSATFVRYRGHAYSLGNFLRLGKGGELHAAGWHGAMADSAFSGLLIRVLDDSGEVVIGRYVS